MNRYIQEVPKVDTNILDCDPFAFSVLRNLLASWCEVTITDQKDIIICLSNRKCNFPVWIWNADGMTAEKMDEIYAIIEKEFPLDDGYEFNVKYQIADYLMKRRKDVGIVTRMLVYECMSLIRPANVDANMGERVLATMEDLDTVMRILIAFEEDAKEKTMSKDNAREIATHRITNSKVYLWKDSSGKTVGCCERRPMGVMEAATMVYVEPSERRKGYASRIVYEVTKDILADGKKAVLYTDEGYPASNACYQKLGYEKREELCTVGRITQ